MKVKIPSIKKNKKTENEDTGFAGFDLTGNSMEAVTSAEPEPDKKRKKTKTKSRKTRSAKGAGIRKIGKPFAARGKKAREEEKPSDDTFGLMQPNEDAFEVSVRNPDPLLKRLDTEQTGKLWVKDLQINLATAAILMAMFSLIPAASYTPEMIPFAIPVVVVFMLLTTLESFDKNRIKLYVAAGLAVALIAALIILRKYIGSGWALVMDQFYDSAEEAQAYIYDRFHIGQMGEEHPYRSQHIALLWGSALTGLLAALPPKSVRRSLAAGLGIFTMIAFAYYGVIPSAICIAVLAAALVFAFARGHILSSLPVFLIVMLVFGAIMLIDPGESYGVSRADEKFRDRFAFRSAFLEQTEDTLDDLSGLEDEQQEEQENNSESGSVFMEEHKLLMTLLIIGAILAAAGAAGWMFRQRLRKKQLANRAGIDSSDPRTAITAMFPYAVRWLQPAGIEPAGKAFGSLIPVIRADVSEQYANSYEGMYELWKEAAYSDHEMTEDNKLEMSNFLRYTMGMIKDKSGFAKNILNTIKYAL